MIILYAWHVTESTAANQAGIPGHGTKSKAVDYIGAETQGREQKAEQLIMYGKRMGMALRDSVWLTCGMPSKKNWYNVSPGIMNSSLMKQVHVCVYL